MKYTIDNIRDAWLSGYIEALKFTVYRLENLDREEQTVEEYIKKLTNEKD